MTKRLSDAEWTLLDPLWERAPLSAREVLEATQATSDWAYTTVRTMLTRLVGKGFLEVTTHGGRSMYRPLVGREAAQRSALTSLIERAFGGRASPVVHHILDDETLTAEDRDALREELRREFGGDE